MLIGNSSEDFYLERIWIRVYKSQSNDTRLEISGIDNADDVPYNKMNAFDG